MQKSWLIPWSKADFNDVADVPWYNGQKSQIIEEFRARSR
jgi:hypothetical protein